MTTARVLKRYLVYPLQALGIYLALMLCRALPIAWASAIGSFLFRTFGPRLRAGKVARRNLEKAFPELSERERDGILYGMWDNLGRGAGEWPHLMRICRDPERVEVHGLEIMEEARDSGEPFIMVSGHMGNWEVVNALTAMHGVRLTAVYRSAQNPWMDRLFRRERARFSGELLPKGRFGAKALIRALASGKPVGMLVDQKLNEGVPVPFFGRPAMTATAPAALGMRFRCKVLPLRLERLPGIRFRVTIFPAMRFPEESDQQLANLAFMTEINRMLEDWIRERPEQWFWVHRRWPDS